VHQCFAVLRSAEARGIDGDEMRGGGEERPGRLEGVYAFGPRAHQDRIGTALAAFGVADGQSVNLDCLRVDHGAHRHSLSGANSSRARLPVVDRAVGRALTRKMRRVRLLTLARVASSRTRRASVGPRTK